MQLNVHLIGQFCVRSFLKTSLLLQSNIAARLLQTRGFKRNIRVKYNKPVTSNIAKIPNPPNIFQGPSLELQKNAEFTCVNSVNLAKKTSLFRKFFPNSEPNISLTDLPPLTRKPKCSIQFKKLTHDEISQIIKQRQEDPKTYTVSALSRSFNCPPLQIMQTVFAPTDYKQKLSAKLDTFKYRRRNLLRTRRKEVAEDAWHHYHL